MPARHARPHRSWWTGLVGVLAALGCAVGLVLLRPGSAPVPVAGSVGGPGVAAAEVLRGWDAARAGAWADGSVRDLRRLYADGAGERDVGLLRRYLGRGLRVDALRVQVLALDVLGHRPGEWRLRVTDRVAGGVVVDPTGVRRPLPRDQATAREVRLVRRGEAWRVAEVVPLDG